MKINDLCSYEENRLGFSAYYLGFDILIYKSGAPWRRVASEEELHEIIEIQGGDEK